MFPGKGCPGQGLSGQKINYIGILDPIEGNLSSTEFKLNETWIEKKTSQMAERQEGVE